MKLRIKDSAVRFRITLKELEEFRATRRLEGCSLFPQPSGRGAEFRYIVRLDPESAASSVEILPFQIALNLCLADFNTLGSAEEEGVYLRREWIDENGAPHRFMAFIEKDRPGSTCMKPEEWIYEEIPGRRPDTRPIPGPRPPEPHPETQPAG